MRSIDYSDYFRTQFELVEKDKITVKSKINILLCGAHHPIAELDKLVLLRNRLIEKGWLRTKLVSDYRHARTGKKRGLMNSRDRSFYAIDKSDVVFFIFTKGGQSDGRGMEVEHVFQTPFLLWNSVFVFEQESNGTPYGSELILEHLREVGDDVQVAYVSVNDENELVDIIESHLVNHLDKLPKAISRDSASH